MVEAVHTAVRGRARYRVDGLYRSWDLKKHLEETLPGNPGIRFVSANHLTGKILVLYDERRTYEDVARLLADVVTGSARQNTAIRKLSDPHASPAVITEQRKPLSVRAARKRVRASEAPAEEQWHLKKAQEPVEAFDSNGRTGLSKEAYEANHRRYGPNLLPESVPRSGWSIVAEQFTSLPVLLLGVAAGISLLTGGLADAVVIAGVVGINAVIGYVTESGSERTIHSLKSLVRPHALVTREGRMRQVGVEEVVPGDILVLRPGTYVAADARLLESEQLSADESALTGESMPVAKDAEPLEGDELSLAERKNMVYMGTLITGGQGVAVVVATGRYTEMGCIQALVESALSPATPMEQQLDRMGRRLALMSGAVCLGVFFVGLLRGYGMLRMLKVSVSLAVAAVPEGLPAVATTTLALGIRKMRKHHVLIRRLEAIETLGSVQTICLDKTGTLTLNQMTVVRVHVGEEQLHVAEGRFTSSQQADVNPYLSEELIRLLHVGALCNESRVFPSNGSQVVKGTPTENALIHLAMTSGVDVIQLRDSFPVLRIMHRSENRNIMVTVHEIASFPTRLVAVKGSPPEVLALCEWYMKEDKRLPLTLDERERIEEANVQMAGEGLRVLGLAFAPHHEGDVEEDNGAFAVADLVWLGIVGMTDPIRPVAKQVIHSLHAAGIGTVMITGDQSATAFAVAKELDLAHGAEVEIVDSRNLASMPPEVLKALSGRVHVFARVSPAHKLQIVDALQEAGRGVAMTGDGINDGPALKAAGIGVAMGHAGTDVAREVADVVLEDDNLETMMIAISEGRTIYNNIRKTIRFLLATNMSEVMVTATSISVGLGEPLSPMQLLWINLVSDIFPGLALALEPPEPDVLLRPPRDPGEEILEAPAVKRMLVESAVLSSGAMGAYGYGLLRYGRGPRAGTMAFLSLTMGQLLHAISTRSPTRTIYDRERLPANPYLTGALAGCFLLQGVALVFPPLRQLLGITRIGLIDGLVVAGGAVLPLLANEGIKKSQRGTP